jgi:hypothetical protein
MHNNSNVTTVELELTRDQIREALSKCKLSYEQEAVIRMRYGVSLKPSDKIVYRNPEDEELQAKIAIITMAIMDYLDEAAQQNSDPATMDDLKNI